MGWFQDLRARYEDQLEQYGVVLVVTYFSIFFLTLGGFWVALRNGIDVSSVVGEAGAAGGAYLATKVTQPVRIVASLVLTPPIAAVVHRLRGAAPTPPDPTSTSSPSSE